jgi:hypothetical protein
LKILYEDIENEKITPISDSNPKNFYIEIPSFWSLIVGLILKSEFRS